jgi:digeranylgeranylglycerophospholipid reductase
VVQAAVTIAADGVESKFSRWCGVDTTVPIREMMSCAQYLMTDISIDEECKAVFLGNEVAPRGYLWIFPKGARTANVGIGISGDRSGTGHRARDYLDRFVRSRFPDGKIIEGVVGGVPVCRPPACMVADGLILAGDAARVVDPLTGGGIYNAMFSGDLAATVASKAIRGGVVNKAALMPYDEGWRQSEVGRAIARSYRIKEYYIRLTDEKLNMLVHMATLLDLKERSTLTLIQDLMNRVTPDAPL